MKNFPHRMLVLVCMVTGASALAQQNLQKNDINEIEVTQYTAMERFEPGLMPSAQKRVELKQEYRAEIKRRREMLDTMHISERKRERLLNDLIKNPFSSRLSRTLAEIEFEDGK